MCLLLACAGVAVRKSVKNSAEKNRNKGIMRLVGAVVFIGKILSLNISIELQKYILIVTNVLHYIDAQENGKVWIRKKQMNG